MQTCNNQDRRIKNQSRQGKSFAGEERIIIIRRRRTSSLQSDLAGKNFFLHTKNIGAIGKALLSLHTRGLCDGFAMGRQTCH
jgi:hypothetical protein